MPLETVGTINMAVLSPLSLSVMAGLGASLAGDLALVAQLSGQLSVTPPSFAVDLSVLAQLQAALSAAISVGLPQIDFQAAAMIKVIAELEFELAFGLEWLALLDAGFFAYGYNGTGREFGAAVDAVIGLGWPDGTSPTANCNALIIATATQEVWDDIRVFFDVIPPSLPTGLTYVAGTTLELSCGFIVGAAGPVIADLRARLDGAIALALKLSVTPPTFAASLTGVIDLVAAIEAAVQLNLPGVDFMISAVAKLIARITAKIELLVRITTAMSGAGAFVYSYSGPASGLGPALTSELATSWPGDVSNALPANAFVIATVDPGAWSILSTFFGGNFTKAEPECKRTEAAFTVLVAP